MLPDPGYHPAVFSRLTGLDPEVLRKYRTRGVFEPSTVDRRGRPLYGADQLASARLLAALVGTGMTASRAGELVATGDRGGVEHHLTVVQGLLGQAREHLPLRGGVWRCWVERTAVHVVELPERTGVDQLVALAGAARRQLAVRLGCQVGELPGWESDGDLLQGPAVTVLLGDDEAPGALRELLLPLPPGTPPHGGRPREERGGWAVAGTASDVEAALDPDAPDALLGRGGVLDEVVGSASRRGWGIPGPVRLLLSDDLSRAAPLVRLR